MGFDKDFGMAFAKSQIASANSLPTNGLAFISLKDSHKDEGIDLAKKLIKLSFKLCATKGTAEYIKKHGMNCSIINKVSSGSPHIVDVLNSKKIFVSTNVGSLIVIDLETGKLVNVIKVDRGKISRPFTDNKYMYLVRADSIIKLN